MAAEMVIKKRDAWWTSKGSVAASAKQAMLDELVPRLGIFNRYISGGVGAETLLRSIFDNEFEKLEILVHQFRGMMQSVEESEAGPKPGDGDQPKEELGFTAKDVLRGTF